MNKKVSKWLLLFSTIMAASAIGASASVFADFHEGMGGGNFHEGMGGGNFHEGMEGGNSHEGMEGNFHEGMEGGNFHEGMGGENSHEGFKGEGFKGGFQGENFQGEGFRNAGFREHHEFNHRHFFRGNGALFISAPAYPPGLYTNYYQNQNPSCYYNPGYYYNGIWVPGQTICNDYNNDNNYYDNSGY